MPPDWRLLAASVKKQERVETIIRRLNEQYPEPPIPLDHSDAFTLLIAVLLSAQCTDKKVNEVTPALFAAGPNPAAMGALSEAEILGFIRQLGLAKTKAKNVKRLAELLLERHGGEVPGSFEALEALPGVGHKTASVVMSQAFGVPASQWIPTFTGSPNAGGSAMATAWFKPKPTSNGSSPKSIGTACTCRSFFGDESSAPPAAVMAASAPCALSSIPTAVKR